MAGDCHVGRMRCLTCEHRIGPRSRAGQIDLTNDQVVIALFADGGWETAMSPITFEDDDGKIETLKLEEKLFRNLPGLLSVAGEQGEE
jgi:hypothetical protein